MCLTIPQQVSSIEGKTIRVIDFEGRKRRVGASLIKVKPGDFVILKNNYIINKLTKKEAESIIRLLKKYEQK